MIKDLLQLQYYGYSVRSWLVLTTGMLAGVTASTRIPAGWHVGLIPTGILVSLAITGLVIIIAGSPKKPKTGLSMTLPGTARYLHIFTLCLVVTWVAWTFLYAVSPSLHHHRLLFVLGLLVGAVIAWVVPALVCGAAGIKTMQDELDAAEEQQLLERTQFLQKIKEAVSTRTHHSNY